MKIDIVCPLYKAKKYIDNFIRLLRAQEDVEIDNVIFPITESKEDDDYVLTKIEEAGYRYFLVQPEAFSHSLTREKAIFDYCCNNIVVMISQDVVLFDKRAIAELVSVMNEKVIYAYGKQVCPQKTIEYYIRQKNYGDVFEIISAKDINRLKLKAFFASDAFSAYYRPAFIALNGYDHIHMMMSEDMYYSKKVLDCGYQKAYVAAAVVQHSHKLTLKELYRRYYETGIWFGQHIEFDGYKTTDSGLELAVYVLGSALKDFNVPVLFRWLPDMTARYFGMRAGKKSFNKISNKKSYIKNDTVTMNSKTQMEVAVTDSVPADDGIQK